MGDTLIRIADRWLPPRWRWLLGDDAMLHQRDLKKIAERRERRLGQRTGFWFARIVHSWLGHPAGNLTGPRDGRMFCGGCRDSFPLRSLKRRAL